MSRRILVTGASVAGNTVAWWLTRLGETVEVVERAPAFSEGGQNVDVRGTAREVLRRMGLEQAALIRNTGERGTDWVDEEERTIARFAVDDVGDGPTAEMEILRGDIARIIHDAVRERAEFRFGDSIAAIVQHDHGVDVRFVSGREARYDLVVVAEGVGSATRELVFPSEARSRWMDITIAFFSIPETAGDGAFARQYNTVGGRGATLKPGPDSRLHVFLGLQKKPEGEQHWDAGRQKAWLRERFAGDGWLIPRLLDGMDETDDFYFDVLRMLRMERWSKGRVILTGDAAWCATPLSGIGTTLAIVGGYVLAGELSRSADLATAMANYERVMRPFVDEGQAVPKIVPRLLWPHSRPGLTLLRGAMRLAGTPPMRRLFAAAFVRNARKVALPDYRHPAAERRLVHDASPVRDWRRRGIAAAALAGVGAAGLLWLARRSKH